MFLTGTFPKLLQNILAYSFASEHSNHFFGILRRKNIAFCSGVDPPTPPLADAGCKLF